MGSVLCFLEGKTIIKVRPVEQVFCDDRGWGEAFSLLFRDSSLMYIGTKDNTIWMSGDLV